MLALALLILAAPDDPSGLLLRAAERAWRAGHRPAVERHLRAWATLGGNGTPATPLRSAAEEARSWALEAGRFRLYASRIQDRVRVGVHDPAGLVTRVRATARAGDASSVLQRLESESPGRIEYVLEPGLPPDVDIEVVAEMNVEGETVLLRRLTLVPPGRLTLPPAPDPTRPPPGPIPHAAPPPGEDPGLAWWWIVVGVAALGFAGAAIVQEARF
ncbi:MAG: hypothetical protein IT384_21480 [Deltaproteobacteria bacterium]|nr:hypothetical protein [Deltaproteobacteria bacterium]